MSDITETLKSKANQLNADDLVGGNIIIKITGKTINVKEDQPVKLNYEGDNGKPYKPCLSMRRVIAAAWGSDSDNYVGKSMELYRDPNVSYGGLKVGGIRIARMSHLKDDLEVVLKANNKKHVKFVIGVLQTNETPKQKQQEKKPELSAEDRKKAAEAFATKLKKAVVACTSSDELKLLVEENEAAIRKLQDNYSDAAEKLILAVEQKTAEFSINSDDTESEDEVELF